MIIYKATNKKNGKSYIGQTIKTLKERMYDHKYDAKYRDFTFYQAIRKYGWKNFEWSVLEEVSSIEELNKQEGYWIGYYDTYCNGYNSTLGGEYNPMHNEENRKKVSEGLKRYYQREGSHWVGGHHTEETKRKMSESALGRKRSKEARKKQSKSRKRKIANGEIEIKSGKEHANSRMVKQIDKETGKVIKIWDTISEAERTLNGKVTGIINRVCSPKCTGNKTFLGYIWEYVD